MTAGLGHNSGLDPEAASAEMAAALQPYRARKDEFASKAKATSIEDLEAAEDAVDFIRMARALKAKADELKRETQEPYDRATAAVRNTAQRFIDEIDDAIRVVQDKLNGYRDKRAEAAEKARLEQEAEERRMREASAAPSLPKAPVKSSAPLAPSRKTAPIRTKMGGMASEQQRWTAKVVDVSQVPKHILESEPVMAAIARVAGDMMKHGIAVPGVEKDTYTTTTIR